MEALARKVDFRTQDNLQEATEANVILHKNNQKNFEEYESLFAAKRERRKKIENVSPMIKWLSMSISLVLVITAINWKTYDKMELVDLGDVQADFEELIEVPLSEQPPPPPPEPQLAAPNIVEVPDEVILEEVEFELDMEVTEDTRVEEVIITYEEPVEEEVEEIFNIVEDQPQPIGGMKAFYEYVGENIKYPDQARRMGITGLVFMSFVVEKDGTLTDIKVVKGIGAGCDEEATRVLAGAPAWKPGKQRGRPVRVYMTVPIRFVLATGK